MNEKPSLRLNTIESYTPVEMCLAVLNEGKSLGLFSMQPVDDYWSLSDCTDKASKRNWYQLRSVTLQKLICVLIHLVPFPFDQDGDSSDVYNPE